ncbi:unnamed protein product [[Candida] boidinii]|nr:unnamed protein product [[Candida] boidinii]
MDKKKPFLWLHISVLREYLEVELNIPRLPFTFDIERAIDDWIFMCFFVGNDFLPHLPSLSVRDNGIDLLVNIWKKNLPRLKTYMTCDGSLNLEGVEVLLGELSKQEDEIFRKRREGERRREDNFKRRKFEEQQQVDLKNQLLKTVSKGKDKAPLQPHQNIPLYNPGGNLVGGLQLSNSDIVKNITTISKANMANKSAAEILRQSLMNNSNAADKEKSEEKDDDSEYDPSKEASEPIDASEDSNKRKLEESNSESTTVEDSEEEGDSIKLWEPGYRNRYYQEKFHTKDEQEINRIKKDMTYCYIQGVSWVLLYYYQGCPSWNWYYPYHYAPFAADFNDLGSMEITFKLGKPFHPFEQLMSVLPAASGHHLPDIFRPLMSDENSEIVDFYPEDFTIDMNGEKMAWKGVALLPFIDETRLLRVVRDKYQYLTEAELERNSLKGEVLYVASKSKLFKKLKQELYSDKVEELILHSSTSGLSGKASIAKDYDAEIDVPFHLNYETDKFMPVPSSTFMKIAKARG